MFKKKTVDKYTYMTETPVPKLITELAVPTIISMLITGIYNTADTYFVGRVPGEATAATAAVGLVFPLMAVIHAFGFFFGHGSGNFLSRMLGAGKKKESSEMASNGFVMALLFGITIAILGNIFMGPLVEFLASDKVDASTLAMTDDYARIILIGAPFMMCQFVINSQLRFQGSAVYAMVGLVAGAIVNIILDPILILVLKMNVTGAAIATVLGQITSFVILLIGCSKGENIRLSLKNVNINKYYIVQIINGIRHITARPGHGAQFLKGCIIQSHNQDVLRRHSRILIKRIGQTLVRCIQPAHSADPGDDRRNDQSYYHSFGQCFFIILFFHRSLLLPCVLIQHQQLYFNK